MKGVVLYNKEKDAYARYEHSDSPKIIDSPVEQATVFWPDEFEEGYEEELIGMTAMYWHEDPDHIEIKEAEVKITV